MDKPLFFLVTIWTRDGKISQTNKLTAYIERFIYDTFNLFKSRAVHAQRYPSSIQKKDINVDYYSPSTGSAPPKKTGRTNTFPFENVTFIGQLFGVYVNIQCNSGTNRYCSSDIVLIESIIKVGFKQWFERYYSPTKLSKNFVTIKRLKTQQQKQTQQKRATGETQGGQGGQGGQGRQGGQGGQQQGQRQYGPKTLIKYCLEKSKTEKSLEEVIHDNNINNFIRKIGAGASGAIVLQVRTRNGSDLILKLYTNPQLKQRAIREIVTYCALSASEKNFFPQIFDYGKVKVTMSQQQSLITKIEKYIPKTILKAIPFLLMEFLEGKSLFRWTRIELSSLSADKLDTLINNIWAAKKEFEKILRQTQQQRPRHMDLHPGNIIVDKDLNVKLIDFDMASYDNLQKLQQITLTPIEEPKLPRKLTLQFIGNIIGAKNVTGFLYDNRKVLTSKKFTYDDKLIYLICETLQTLKGNDKLKIKCLPTDLDKELQQKTLGRKTIKGQQQKMKSFSQKQQQTIREKALQAALQASKQRQLKQEQRIAVLQQEQQGHRKAAAIAAQLSRKKTQQKQRQRIAALQQQQQQEYKRNVKQQRRRQQQEHKRKVKQQTQKASQAAIKAVQTVEQLQNKKQIQRLNKEVDRRKEQAIKATQEAKRIKEQAIKATQEAKRIKGQAQKEKQEAQKEKRNPQQVPRQRIKIQELRQRARRANQEARRANQEAEKQKKGAERLKQEAQELARIAQNIKQTALREQLQPHIEKAQAYRKQQQQQQSPQESRQRLKKISQKQKQQARKGQQQQLLPPQSLPPVYLQQQQQKKARISNMPPPSRPPPLNPKQRQQKQKKIDIPPLPQITNNLRQNLKKKTRQFQQKRRARQEEDALARAERIKKALELEKSKQKEQQFREKALAAALQAQKRTTQKEKQRIEDLEKRQKQARKKAQQRALEEYEKRGRQELAKTTVQQAAAAAIASVKQREQRLKGKQEFERNEPPVNKSGKSTKIKRTNLAYDRPPTPVKGRPGDTRKQKQPRERRKNIQSFIRTPPLLPPAPITRGETKKLIDERKKARQVRQIQNRAKLEKAIQQRQRKKEERNKKEAERIIKEVQEKQKFKQAVYGAIQPKLKEIEEREKRSRQIEKQKQRRQKQQGQKRRIDKLRSNVNRERHVALVPCIIDSLQRLIGSSNDLRKIHDNATVNGPWKQLKNLKESLITMQKSNVKCTDANICGNDLNQSRSFRDIFGLTVNDQCTVWQNTNWAIAEKTNDMMQAKIYFELIGAILSDNNNFKESYNRAFQEIKQKYVKLWSDYQAEQRQKRETEQQKMLKDLNRNDRPGP